MLLFHLEWASTNGASALTLSYNFPEHLVLMQHMQQKMLKLLKLDGTKR